MLWMFSNRLSGDDLITTQAIFFDYCMPESQVISAHRVETIDSNPLASTFSVSFFKLNFIYLIYDRGLNSTTST